MEARHQERFTSLAKQILEISSLLTSHVYDTRLQDAALDPWVILPGNIESRMSVFTGYNTIDILDSIVAVAPRAPHIFNLLPITNPYLADVLENIPDESSFLGDNIEGTPVD